MSTPVQAWHDEHIHIAHEEEDVLGRVATALTSEDWEAVRRAGR